MKNYLDFEEIKALEQEVDELKALLVPESISEVDTNKIKNTHRNKSRIGSSCSILIAGKEHKSQDTKIVLKLIFILKNIF